MDRLPERRRIANRRASITFGFECNGLRYAATISRYSNGDLAETFINNCAAVVCSLALQHGADIGTIRRTFCRDSNGRPTPRVGAALDLIAEEDKR
jgi:hypothetical protein